MAAAVPVSCGVLDAAELALSCLRATPFGPQYCAMQTASRGSGRRESAPALLAGYEGLLAHLKSQGALLNAVKPELLLDIADFR